MMSEYHTLVEDEIDALLDVGDARHYSASQIRRLLAHLKLTMPPEVERALTLRRLGVATKIVVYFCPHCWRGVYTIVHALTSQEVACVACHGIGLRWEMLSYE